MKWTSKLFYGKGKWRWHEWNFIEFHLFLKLCFMKPPNLHLNFSRYLAIIYHRSSVRKPLMSPVDFFFQIFCKTLIDTCQESRNFLRPWGLVIYIRKSSIRTRFSTRFSLNRIESVQTQTSILFFSSLLSFFCYCISFYFSLQVVRRETPF